jgi:TPR repeat protein
MSVIIKESLKKQIFQQIKKKRLNDPFETTENAEAILQLARHHLKGKEGKEHDLFKARLLLEKAASLGNKKARIQLADYTTRG